MFKKEALDLHRKLRGKFEIKSKVSLKSAKQLSLLYTPGVAEVSKEIFKTKNPYDYTIKSNSVAIVTDGSSVLGLGNIGPEAALPVMEGKAILFKELANVDAFPICLKTQNTKEIIETVKNISPVFGGINLEDIKAPKCFEIEEKLQNIGIPVMHDDQHATAVVILAGLLNACKVTKKSYEDLKVVINGAGAAGTATSKLLMCSDYHAKICRTVHDVIVCDSKGIIHKGRKDLSGYKQKLAQITNRHRMKGKLKDAIVDADVFIGLSVANVLKESMIKDMEKSPVVFAMANPTPEIMPNLAKRAGAKIIATGRSDFPNQINNVLAFPGIFRGALDGRAKEINNGMKIAAAQAIANSVKNPNKNKIIPSPLEKQVVKNIAKAVIKNI